MVGDQPPNEDKGLSVWVIVGVIGAIVVLLAGAAALLMNSNGSEPEAGPPSTTIPPAGTTTPPAGPTTTTQPTTTTSRPVTTTISRPVTTTTPESLSFPLEPGTPVAALSSFSGVTEVELSFGDLDIGMITTGTWAEDRYRCENSTDLGDLSLGVSVVATVDRIWVDRGQGMLETSFFDPDVENAISSCPANPSFWLDFEAPPSPSGGQAEVRNGIAVQRFEIDELLAAFLDLDVDEGMEIEDSTIWIADPGGWVAGLEVSMAIQPDKAAEVFGLPLSDDAGPATMSFSISIADPDDPDLVVWLPPPNFDFFLDEDDLVVLGEARIDRDQKLLRLTSSTNAVIAGAAWFERKQHVEAGFETVFTFRMTDIGPNPGEGLAFVIQNHAPNAMGIGASGIGYKEMPNSLAVEFDTVYQDYEDDSSDSHIAVHTSGVEPNTTHEVARLGYVDAPFELADDDTHVARIVYVDGELSVFLDDDESPRLVVEVDLASNLELAEGMAWLGFTASTAPGFRQSNDILAWEFVPVQRN